MSGNNFFKSAAGSMGLARSFYNILTLIVPFDTKKTCNKPIPLPIPVIGTDTLNKDSHALRKSNSVRSKELRSFVTRRT